MILEITPDGFVHICGACGKKQLVLHSQVEERKTVDEDGNVTLTLAFVSCEVHKPGAHQVHNAPDCYRHSEHFNHDIPAEQQGEHDNFVRMLYQYHTKG